LVQRHAQFSSLPTSASFADVVIVQETITRGELDEQGRVQPTRRDAEAAVGQILKGKKSGLGFQGASPGEEEQRSGQSQTASVA